MMCCLEFSLGLLGMALHDHPWVSDGIISKAILTLLLLAYHKRRTFQGAYLDSHLKMTEVHGGPSE